MSKYTPFNTVDDYKIKLQEAKITLGFSPTADVVEVRHGEWEVCGMFDDFITCSVCKSNKYPFGYGFKYCPECGAKMDGDRREE